MAKLSRFREKVRQALISKAQRLYQQGLTLREVAPIVGKSRTWVWDAVKDLSTELTWTKPDRAVE